MERIYFDNAATTAPYPAVLAAMTETAQGFYGNPSSLHSEGQAAQKLLSACREMSRDKDLNRHNNGITVVLL